MIKFSHIIHVFSWLKKHKIGPLALNFFYIRQGTAPMKLQQYDHSNKTSMIIAPIDSPVWMGEILQGLIMNEQLQAINDCSEWESQVYPKRCPVIGYLFPSGKPQT